MLPGFLGSRATFMFDFVVVAMIAILPILGASIYLVKYRQAYLWHKRLQLTLGAVLLLAVTLFEIDVRMSDGTSHSWRSLAAVSPYYPGVVFPVLTVHVALSVTTCVLWIVVIVRALRNFPVPPQPGSHSAFHKRFAWAAATGMALTSVTGWAFYYLAFVAT